MERDVSTLRAKAVVVEFGWNDHWDALGPPDDETHPSAAAVWLADHVRVYQAYRKAILGWQASRQRTLPRRVAIERYRDNLRQIVRGAQSIGARAVLVTAPTDHEIGAEPDYLRARHLRELTGLVPLHASYVQATRDVARDEGATLCDAAAEMEKLGRARRPFFRADGIHFMPPGDRFMGDLVSGCIRTALAGAK
jgi:lysophospholipase L1-like esterase